ncbi:MAG: hypothetical protein V3V49_12885 [Candidatus Krumholzibacteria bacterium]
MCKPVVVVLVSLLLITSGFTILSAQTPFVAVYFDEKIQVEAATCPIAPPGTVVQRLYVAALNFNAMINAIEFQITFPPELQYIGENYLMPTLTNGTTPTGLQLGFLGGAVDANTALILVEVVLLWQCSACTGTSNAPITVGPNPRTGLLGAFVLGDPDVEIPGVGLTALICPTVPVEPTTWGRVKALYQ